MSEIIQSIDYFILTTRCSRRGHAHFIDGKPKHRRVNHSVPQVEGYTDGFTLRHSESILLMLCCLISELRTIQVFEDGHEMIPST